MSATAGRGFMIAQWLALDVGGANLKAADGLSYAESRAFALWSAPERLSAELAALIAAAPACRRVAATMTGELADCFESKADGVCRIIDALVRAADGRNVCVYLTDGRLVRPEIARSSPLLAAASNWHALASFAARWVTEGTGLLLDMGSTTTDIIPLESAGPISFGRTDPDRLASGELVYTGVERTPVSAIVRSLPWRGRTCPIAAELFATAADAHLLLGNLPEDGETNDTADGRPRTRPAARARLARMICADTTMFSEEDAIGAARAIRDAQLAALEAAVMKVTARMSKSPRVIILSGHGEFLLRRLAEKMSCPAELISLNKLLGPSVSRCATAHALAVIAREALSEHAAP